MIRERFTILLIIIMIAQFLQAQNKDVEIYRKTALEHMKNGRYGEAIDQLNKYISAVPQNPEGYNLRAQCFEQRKQYENAVLDFRRAIALEKNNARRNEYLKNLRRVQEVWYNILNKKIEGHLREIAINPDKPINYLEIGKCYRWMEIWNKAEEWYDEYLKRDDNASPDEIIRYTEILAKTGSIKKGETILKKYVERYPDDWRLWSRYGYFTMWLSKYNIAKDAFEKALAIKPFFKEARDGLDIVNRQAYVTQQNPRAFEKEYPIDRYYRLLKKNPSDVEMRFKLVDELLKAKRIEEAYQQLQIIGFAHSDDERFQSKWDYVLQFRDSLYRLNLDRAKLRLANNSLDKDALKILSRYYEYLQFYDSALTYLNKYFEQVPEENDPELIYQYARILAWNREFDKSIEIMDKLLGKFPDNLDYKLFRAQLSVWTKRDMELAREYLNNVLQKKPNNLDANIAMGSLMLIERNFEEAQKYADKARNIDPTNDEVIKLQSDIDWQKLREEEEKLYSILEKGRKEVLDGHCEDGLTYYEEYMSKAEPNLLILKEYGDVLFCAKKYQRALEAYNQVLESGYNYDAAMQRAKVYYAMDDSVNAVRAFKELVEEDSTDFEAQLYLGDSYSKLGEPDSARKIYNMLLETWDLDSSKVELVKLRKGWLPITGITAILETFPYYVGVAPLSQYYSDNISFSLSTFGIRADLGINNYLSGGFLFSSTRLNSNSQILNPDIISTYNYIGTRNYRTLKGLVTIRISKYFYAGTGLGVTNSTGRLQRDEKEVFANFEIKDTVSVSFTYQNSDGALILYSPYLIDQTYYASLYRVGGYYIHKNGLKISGSFQYISVSDINEGNDLIIRLGKYIYSDLILGYEYYYTNYKFKSQYYYSPQNFESHSFWLDNELEKKKDLTVILGGKIGYIPFSKFIALEGHFEMFYRPLENLTISGRMGMGSTSRDDSSYRYFSTQLSIYWTAF